MRRGLDLLGHWLLVDICSPGEPRRVRDGHGDLKQRGKGGEGPTRERGAHQSDEEDVPPEREEVGAEVDLQEDLLEALRDDRSVRVVLHVG